MSKPVPFCSTLYWESDQYTISGFNDERAMTVRIGSLQEQPLLLNDLSYSSMVRWNNMREWNLTGVRVSIQTLETFTSVAVGSPNAEPQTQLSLTEISGMVANSDKERQRSILLNPYASSHKSLLMGLDVPIKEFVVYVSWNDSTFIDLPMVETDQYWLDIHLNIQGEIMIT